MSKADEIPMLERMSDPYPDIDVRHLESGDYEAVEASGVWARSGNPYLAVVNLLDKLTDERVTFEVSVRGGSDEH